MEFNVSSFYDGEESGKQLNSTALEQDENEQKEWKLSPITSDSRRAKTTIRQKNSHSQQAEFKSPLRTVNTTDPSTSGYDSRSTTALTPQQPSSSEAKFSMSAELSSFVANNSLNPFDSIFLNSLHKSIDFSPRLVISSQESGSQQKNGEKFQWSVEQLAILKPAHISEDEIAASYRSPVPEVEEKIQEALNEYWTKNVSYIPSPDGPRFVNMTHRDGTVTTFKYGGEASTSSAVADSNTPSLANLIRKKEAVKAAYATSSPKQRPRNFRNIRQVRNRTCQTELTIPPNMDLDLKKLLGDSFCYQQDQEFDEEEVFNVSVSSNFSTRRRLFSTSDNREEESEDVANSSMLSTDDLLINESSQAFNDSLSPVRRSEDVTDIIEEVADSMDQENTSATSEATRSHASQIAINISILNDCMMNSIDEAENEDEAEDNKSLNEDEDMGREVFSDSHIHSNEYEMLDRSSSSNATPRNEDLDWTPRRFTGSTNNSIVRSGGSMASGAFSSGGAAPQERRRFVFDMSPIHPNHNLPTVMRTPIQRCHFNLPQGRLNLNDDNDVDEHDESEQ